MNKFYLENDGPAGYGTLPPQKILVVKKSDETRENGLIMFNVHMSWVLFVAGAMTTIWGVTLRDEDGGWFLFGVGIFILLVSLAVGYFFGTLRCFACRETKLEQRMYRCYYCEAWYCETCAKKHFVKKDNARQ